MGTADCVEDGPECPVGVGGAESEGARVEVDFAAGGDVAHEGGGEEGGEVGVVHDVLFCVSKGYAMILGK